MRTKGAALATACDWLFNYFVVQTTPIGIHYLKWGLYLVYAVLNACFVPIIYYLIVETAGKSLEQIDKWFAANPGWLVHKAGGPVLTMSGDDAAGGGYGLVPTIVVDEDESERMGKEYEQHDRRAYDEDMRPIGDDDEIFALEDGEEVDDRNGEGKA